MTDDPYRKQATPIEDPPKPAKPAKPDPWRIMWVLPICMAVFQGAVPRSCEPGSANNNLPDSLAHDLRSAVAAFGITLAMVIIAQIIRRASETDPS